MRSGCLATLLICATSAAVAATIEVKHPDTGPPVVLVTGDFEFSDIDTFSASVAQLSKATVSFASEGGALVAGIRIGTLIRHKRFATLVPDGALCASACAVAWLGGAQRFVGKAAHVGFHAAYVLRAGAMAQSAPGNAVLGAYLDQLGLSEEAIRFVTDAEPSTIHWMSMTEAAEHGIAVALWDAAEPATAVPRNPNYGADDYAEGSPERRATDFARLLPARWSAEDDANALASLYSDVVIYQGSPLARDKVVAQRRRIAERWRRRTYAIRTGSLSATCTGAGGICQVKGLIDWESRASGKRGVTSFDVSLLIEGDTPQIATESSSESPKPQAGQSTKRHAEPSSLKQAGRNFRALLGKLSKLTPLSRTRARLRPEAPVAR